MLKRSGPARVLVNTPEPTDGAALYVLEFVRALAVAGAPVTLFCPCNFDYLTQLKPTGISVIEVPSRPVSMAHLAARLWRNLKWVLQSSAIQWRGLRQGDIVHFQFLIHLPLAFILLLPVRLRGVRMVLTAHDPLPHKWRLAGKLRWFERKMLACAYGVFDIIIVHNQAGRSILMDEFKREERSIAVIPHGPLAAEHSAFSFPAFDTFRVLLFGSIRENKGVHLAIEATQNLYASGLPIQLTIAGAQCTSGQSEYWHSCKRLLSKRPGGIEVIEHYIADSEIAALFANHHAVLLPYVDFFSESGVASLALSNERPLIATAAGGLGELLEASGCGIAIHEPTAASVAKALAAAYELGADQLAQRGAAGAQYIRGTRSWSAIAEKTTEVYKLLQEERLPEANKTPLSFKSSSDAGSNS